MTSYKVLDNDIQEYEAKMGVGPCLPVAMVLRGMGVGQIELGQFGPEGDYCRSFPHYWIRTPDGKMIDLTNPSQGKQGWVYWDIEEIGPDEHPDPRLYGDEDIAFWANRIKEAVHGNSY